MTIIIDVPSIVQAPQGQGKLVIANGELTSRGVKMWPPQGEVHSHVAGLQ